MKQPLISIITVVLNGATTIEDAFRSVFSQNYNNYEYIVVDGGSSDGTVEIIRQHESKLDCWISEPDTGVYDAMNKGVRFAKGKWVCFLGADDVLYNILERVAEYLVDEKTIYYGDVFRPMLGRKYDGYFSSYKLARRNICHQSIFYPRRVWEKYSFDLRYPIFADHELNMRCFSDPEILMKYVPLTIALFNDEGGMSPNQHDNLFEADRLELIKKNFPFTIYLLSRFHFGFICILSQLRLKNVAQKIYHFVLRF